jgi:hypothetical protein
LFVFVGLLGTLVFGVMLAAADAPLVPNPLPVAAGVTLTLAVYAVLRWYAPRHEWPESRVEELREHPRRWLGYFALLFVCNFAIQFGFRLLPETIVVGVATTATSAAVSAVVLGVGLVVVWWLN